MFEEHAMVTVFKIAVSASGVELAGREVYRSVGKKLDL
jgi:hypothetical protein